MLVGVIRDEVEHRTNRGTLFIRLVLCVLTVAPVVRWLVVVHAVRAGRPWRHRCPRCATAIGPSGSVGALTPRARCGVCRQRLGPAPAVVELTLVISAVGLVASGLTGWPVLAYAWWCLLSVALVFVDLSVQRLPARLCYPAAAGLLLVLAAAAATGYGWAAWLRAAVGALLAAGVLAIAALAAPRLVHWGDVRFALAIGAAAGWVGWLALYSAAFLATAAAALTGLALIFAGRATRRTQLPQGPFFYAGTLLAVVLLAR